MWQIVKFESGKWTELGTFEALEQCKANRQKLAGRSKHIYYFWAGKLPTSSKARRKIVDEVIEANEGRIVRVTIGLDLNSAVRAESRAGCGRCFCVYPPGRCEGAYCNDWMCWWVICDSHPRCLEP